MKHLHPHRAAWAAIPLVRIAASRAVGSADDCREHARVKPSAALWRWPALAHRVGGRILRPSFWQVALGCLVIATACADKEVVFGDDEATSEEGDPAESGNSGSQASCTNPSWAAMHTGYDVAFTGVWAASSNDVYAVTLSGALFHYDGNEWSVDDFEPGCRVMAIDGRSRSQVFMAGIDEGCAYHFDGSEWSPLSGQTSPSLRSISVVDEGFLATGKTAGRDSAWWYNGEGWTLVDNEYVKSEGVDARSPEDAYFLGHESINCTSSGLGMGTCDEYGSVLHFNGSSLETLRRIENESYSAIGRDEQSGRLFVFGHRWHPSGSPIEQIVLGDSGPDFIRVSARSDLDENCFSLGEKRTFAGQRAVVLSFGRHQ